MSHVNSEALKLSPPRKRPLAGSSRQRTGSVCWVISQHVPCAVDWRWGCRWWQDPAEQGPSTRRQPGLCSPSAVCAPRKATRPSRLQFLPPQNRLRGLWRRTVSILLPTLRLAAPLQTVTMPRWQTQLLCALKLASPSCSPSPGPDALTCVVETEEEEAGMVLAKGDRLSCGRDDVPWCASRLEERGVLHTARSTPPPWEMGSLLLV